MKKFLITVYHNNSRIFISQKLNINKTSTGPTFVSRSPNQFVDQGYNNFMNSQGNQANPRVIPIAMDGDGSFNNSARGPNSQAPVVIQK